MQTTDIKIQAAKVALDLAQRHEDLGDEGSMARVVTEQAERLGLRPSHDPWETRGMIKGVIEAADL